MSKKLTNEIVDQKLKEQNRTIKRVYGDLGNIIGANKKSWWECLVYGHKWITTPSSIFNNKTDCPNCAGNIRFTNEIIDLKLYNRNIKRDGEYINSQDKMAWQCLKCF